MDLHAVLAIGSRGAARASSDGLEVYVVAATRGIHAREYHRGIGAVSGCGHAIGQSLREGAEDDVRDALARLGPPSDWRRRASIDDGALGRVDRDGAVEAAIGRNGWIEHGLH